MPGNEENAMEAQDTPVISVESNRSNNENENKEVLEYKTIVIDNVYDKLPKRKKFEIL